MSAGNNYFLFLHYHAKALNKKAQWKKKTILCMTGTP